MNFENYFTDFHHFFSRKTHDSVILRISDWEYNCNLQIPENISNIDVWKSIKPLGYR